MAIITLPNPLTDGTLAVGSQVYGNDNTIASDYNGNITNANCAANMGLVDTKLAQIATAGKVSGAAIVSLASLPAGAGVIPSANLPSSSIVPNYRSGLYCMQASTTTITVAPGGVEINSLMVNKTANTTLTITTAGNWAGGSSLQATTTTGYVIMDASGNMLLTTTAPTHADYGLTISAANNTKRFATVSGTVYRYLGWFYMNATGSGQLDAFGVSNLADGGVKNVVEFETGAMATGTTLIPADDTIPQSNEGDQYMSQVFRPTNINNKLYIEIRFASSNSSSTQQTLALFQDSTASAIAAVPFRGDTADKCYMRVLTHYMKAGTIAATTFKVRSGDSTGGTMTFNGISGGRLYGGVLASSIRIEEIESQLT